MTRILKYQQIEGFLMEELSSGKYAPGDRFHSENDVAARFSVTQLTARKAFIKLEHDGYLNRKRGNGTFVAKLPSAPERLAVIRRCIVGIVTPEQNVGSDLKQGRLLSEVHQKLENAGYLTMLTRNGIDVLIESGVTGVVVLGRISGAMERKLLLAGIPAVGFDPENSRIHGIRFDYDLAGSYLVDFLAARKIRHLALVGEGDDALAVRYNFEKPIAQEAVKREIRFSVCVPPVGSAREEFARLMGSPERPDAVFAMNSWCLGMVRSVLDECKLRIGRDISLVVHGLNALLIPSDPPYSLFDVDDAAIASALTDELFNLVRNPEADTRSAPVRYSSILDRGSIVNPEATES